MPTTLTSRPAHSVCKVSSRGISLRQGAHQVAQKLMISDLPPKEAMDVALPARSARANFGSRSGILEGGSGPGTNPPPAPMSSGEPSACVRSLGLGALATPLGLRAARAFGGS